MPRDILRGRRCEGWPPRDGRNLHTLTPANKARRSPQQRNCAGGFVKVSIKIPVPGIDRLFSALTIDE
jgi:hypothetical protein